MIYVMIGMGLGEEYWHDVIKVLKEVIPVYDKVNHAISLGRASRLREKGIRLLMNGYDDDIIVLDAGSGYGNMSKTMLSMNDKARIVMLDPIPEMLMLANERLPSIDKVSGIFENLPFANNTFDLIMCGYSFRDAISYSKAIDEFARVLKDKGRLVIVDIGKPDDMLSRVGAAFYLKYVMPLIAFSIAGRLGLKFKEIYGTFKRLPKNKVLLDMLNARFKHVNLYEELSGAAVIFIAYKG